MAPTRLPVLWIALAVLAAQPAFAAYYSLLGGGAQLEIGDRQMPGQVFGTGTSPTGTMFPPLLIPPKGTPLLKQTAGPDPKKMTIPPGVLFRKAPAFPNVLGLALRNPWLFQVRTRVQFSAPAAGFGTAILSAGGRTGAATTTFIDGAGSTIRYRKSTAQFGGAARIGVQPATPIRQWFNNGAKLPCRHPVFGGSDNTCRAVLLTAIPATVAAPGGKFGGVMTTAAKAPMSPAVVYVSVPNMTGLVANSKSALMSSKLTNKATSHGFPWTTGMVTISAPGAAGTVELFTLTGMDSRIGGKGTISLVSGALSNRSATKPNANRGWLRLTVPEPGAEIGAAGALATLAVCHFLMVRRRKRAAD